MCRTAFYDVDDTLINIKSMFDFFHFWASENKLDSQKEKFDSQFSVLARKTNSREELNRTYYRFFKDVPLLKIEECAVSWFKKTFSTTDIFITYTLKSILAHRVLGHNIVLVSGSMAPLLKPIARLLGVTDILCTELVIDNSGVVTGEILGTQTIGDGKAFVIRQYAEKNNIKLSTCFAYGDDVSDIPMLSCVGHPVCIGEGTKLSNYAADNKWLTVSI
ncbi:HAD family hydrolase [Yersinia sp. 2540 StPb PI]|uniref:HAD family hydrolase n=1 Tax=Yersinia sp. 2540 StPb PI TaxID=3117406 RepID=UPI003FA4A7F1